MEEDMTPRQSDDKQDMARADFLAPAPLVEGIRRMAITHGYSFSEFCRVCLADGFALQCEKQTKYLVYQKVQRRLNADRQEEDDE